ncbi:hypothetical protein ACGFX4_38090 [Kitasatospora sp. NPDC048365]|uniref:hypothetical protein n=1 Tax=Kitasatospora sp. NPDC048365 TaxID=3364050 RepID=UPI00371D19C9
MAGLTEAPSPESTVDVALAVRTGQVRLRRRRLAAVGAAMAVVLTGSAVLSLRPSGAPAPAAPTVSASPSALPSTAPQPSGGAAAGAAPVTAAPVNGKDPLTVDADFGWLPAEANAVHYQLSPYETTVRGESADSIGPRLTLKVFAAGVVPDAGKSPLGAMGVRQDVAPVNGRTAFLVTAAGDHRNGALYWQGPEGRWLELYFLYLSGADSDQVVHKVAEKAVVGRHSVPLPATFTQAPKSFTLSSGSFERENIRGQQWWTMQLNYAAGPGQYFSTTITPDGERPDPHPEITDRPPAPLGDSDPGTCRSENGLKVCVRVAQEKSMLDPVGGPAGWLSKVGLLGMDETRWTTDVLP